MKKTEVSLTPDEWKIIVTNIGRQLRYTIDSVETGRYDINATVRAIHRCMAYIDIFCKLPS